MDLCPTKMQQSWITSWQLKHLILKEVEDRQNKILDANYNVVDIDAKVAAMDYLNDQQKQRLNRMLKKFPKLFSGGLETLDIEPVHLESNQVLICSIQGHILFQMPMTRSQGRNPTNFVTLKYSRKQKTPRVGITTVHPAQEDSRRQRSNKFFVILTGGS